jgi:hypothetical protein
LTFKGKERGDSFDVWSLLVGALPVSFTNWEVAFGLSAHTATLVTNYSNFVDRSFRLLFYRSEAGTLASQFIFQFLGRIGPVKEHVDAFSLS